MPPAPEGEAPQPRSEEAPATETPQGAAKLAAPEVSAHRETTFEEPLQGSVDEDRAAPAKTTVPENGAGQAPTLTMEEAAARIGPKVLQALEEKFNGSLAELRDLDEKDQFLY